MFAHNTLQKKKQNKKKKKKKKQKKKKKKTKNKKKKKQEYVHVDVCLLLVREIFRSLQFSNNFGSIYVRAIIYKGLISLR